MGFWNIKPTTNERLANIEKMLRQLLNIERKQIMDLGEIKNKVAENTEVDASAIKLLGELSGLIKAHIDDPAKLQEIADSLDANKAALAAAIVENTPAAGE